MPGPNVPASAWAIHRRRKSAANHDACSPDAPDCADVKKGPKFAYKNVYQESEHVPLNDALTKFNASSLNPYSFLFCFVIA